jgi:hypothetical protein
VATVAYVGIALFELRVKMKSWAGEPAPASDAPVSYIQAGADILAPVNLNIAVFWSVTSCSLPNEHQRSEEACCLSLTPWRWRQQIPPKRWYLPTRLHDDTSHMTEIFFQSLYLNRCFIKVWIQMSICIFRGARGSVVFWGTMLQAGRSRVRFPTRSLHFSIYLILPATQWPWGQLSL